MTSVFPDYSLQIGDCRELLAALPDNCIDSCVTDPPYELGFMGKGWDRTGIANDAALWREVLRVLKPGSYLLAFSGTRTYHRMACAIEDAGLEIRDQLGWMYGSGFPKSLSVGDGWGTALKPAWEPICMARKPLAEKTVAANVLAHGTGALNIDGCRVHGGPSAGGSVSGSTALGQGSGWNAHENRITEIDRSMAAGRFPANLIHDGSDEVLALFPDSKGQQGDVRGTEPSRTGGEGTNCYGEYSGARPPAAKRGDSGSAARFFYCAKASKSDRHAGGADNKHPTVKPTDLMRYLCRLVTPKRGVVLDPFTGSGSTGRGALLEGFRFVGMEQDISYSEIAETRLRDAYAEAGRDLL